MKYLLTTSRPPQSHFGFSWTLGSSGLGDTRGSRSCLRKPSTPHCRGAIKSGDQTAIKSRSHIQWKRRHKRILILDRHISFLPAEKQGHPNRDGWMRFWFHGRIVGGSLEVMMCVRIIYIHDAYHHPELHTYMVPTICLSLPSQRQDRTLLGLPCHSTAREASGGR